VGKHLGTRNLQHDGIDGEKGDWNLEVQGETCAEKGI
jgi:hypothetical protein